MILTASLSALLLDLIFFGGGWGGCLCTGLVVVCNQLWVLGFLIPSWINAVPQFPVQIMSGLTFLFWNGLNLCCIVLENKNIQRRQTDLKYGPVRLQPIALQLSYIPTKNIRRFVGFLDEGKCHIQPCFLSNGCGIFSLQRNKQWICVKYVSSLCRGHFKLLVVVAILVFVLQ